jgi:KDO2-lipid IV(A) lauroyltransferase
MSFITYLLFRIAAFPLSYFPASWIEKLGNFLGIALYYCYPKYRKRALSNIALSSGISPAETVALAKASLQNLAITFLEYPKLAREKDVRRIAVCENPETAAAIIQSGKGVIFFCGHQANWEVLFLEGTSRMPGVAIGRPTKNKYLYRWVVAIREKFGGTMIPPQNALKEGLRALKNGKFLGVVGDQGMPNSGFSSIFLGKRAWTSPLPALLSIRTGCPIIVASTRREKDGYKIHYSDPIWPTPETEPEPLMRLVLSLFEQTIKDRPHEWLWIHNRWKQQLPGRLSKKYRYDAICLILPEDPALVQDVAKIREIYPTEFITAYVPEKMDASLPSDIEIRRYGSVDDILIPDYQFKLVLNFTPDKRIAAHFKKLSAFQVHTLNTYEELCQATGFTAMTT